MKTLMGFNSQQSLLQRTVFCPSGGKYTGEWLGDKKHGERPYISPHTVTPGPYACNLFQGRGTQVWNKAGAVYIGEWKHGRRDGHGTYSVLVPGTKDYAKKYCGEWKNGRKHVRTSSGVTCMHQKMRV